MNKKLLYVSGLLLVGCPLFGSIGCPLETNEAERFMHSSDELVVQLEQAYQGLGVYDERYKVMPNGKRDYRYGVKRFLNCLLEILNKRALTDEEIARYVTGNDPMRVVHPVSKKVVDQKIMDGLLRDLICEEFIVVELLSALVKRGHLDAVDTVVLKQRTVEGMPFWICLAEGRCGEILKNEVFLKLPSWLRFKFEHAPEYILRTEESPNILGAGTESDGIFYDSTATTVTEEKYSLPSYLKGGSLIVKTRCYLK